MALCSRCGRATCHAGQDCALCRHEGEICAAEATGVVVPYSFKLLLQFRAHHTLYQECAKIRFKIILDCHFFVFFLMFPGVGDYRDGHRLEIDYRSRRFRVLNVPCATYTAGCGRFGIVVVNIVRLDSSNVDRCRFVCFRWCRGHDGDVTRQLKNSNFQFRGFCTDIWPMITVFRRYFFSNFATLNPEREPKIDCACDLSAFSPFLFVFAHPPIKFSR